MQLKNNQKALRHAVIAACAVTTSLSSTRTCDRNRRNRQDTRTATVFDAAALGTAGWKNHINVIIRVERATRTHLPATGYWKRSDETAYYLSNTPISAEAALQAIRDHWGIENRSHYVRDVTLREDASRIRHKPGLFAKLRSFAHNLLRFNQAETIAQDRYAAALGGFDALAAMQFTSEN